MNTTTIRTFTPGDISPVMELQEAYNRKYPGVPLIPGGLYLSPAFHEGQDVFCAFQMARDGESLVAYAPVYAQIVADGPAELAHQVWTEIKAHPDLPDAESVKDLLLERVEQHAQELVAPFPGRQSRLIFEYLVNETPAIEYVLARGFQYTKSAFSMRRGLDAPVPDGRAPQSISIRRWRMETEAEQQAYVSARNACFPEAPVSLPEWQYYLQSPQWAAGTMIAAFDGAELAGAVNVFWNEKENQGGGQRSGYTEDIFVRPAWRGKGIARAAIIEALKYLKEHDLSEACLRVSALNENALGLYTGLGYQTVQESRFFARDL